MTEVSNVNLYRKTYYEGDKNCWGKEYFLEEHGEPYQHICCCSKGLCRTEPLKDVAIKSVSLNGNFKWILNDNPREYLNVYINPEGRISFEYSLSEEELVYNTLNINEDHFTLQFYAPFYDYGSYTYSFSRASPRSEEDLSGSYHIGGVKGGILTRLIEDGELSSFRTNSYTKEREEEKWIWNYATEDKITPGSWFHSSSGGMSRIGGSCWTHKYYGAKIADDEVIQNVIDKVLHLQQLVEKFIEKETKNLEDQISLANIEELLKKEFQQEKYRESFDFIVNLLKKTPYDFPESWKMIIDTVKKTQYPDQVSIEKVNLDSDFVYNNYQRITGQRNFRNGHQICLSEITTFRDTPFVKKYKEFMQTYNKHDYSIPEEEYNKELAAASVTTYYARCPTHAINYNTGSTLEEVLAPYQGLENIKILSKSFGGSVEINKIKQMINCSYEKQIHNQKVLEEARRILGLGGDQEN